MLKLGRLVCCLGWAVVIFLTEMSRAGIFKELKTDGTYHLNMINLLGVPIGGTDHLLFEAKGKGRAYIILSESNAFSPVRGRYYCINLAFKNLAGKQRNNGIKYGCINCNAFHATGVGTSIVADKFTQLWVSWKDGQLKVGHGTDINSDHPILKYKGPQSYGVNFISIFTSKVPGEWRFRIDNPPLFIVPLPSGSTVITVPENSPVNKVVFDIVCEDPENDTITFTLKNHENLFHVDKSTVVLSRTLDYEKQRQYSLMIEAFDGLHKVPVAVSVKVVDVNDEAPVVVIIEDLSIPEEFRVGTVLGGLFEATDADHNDKPTFTLQGGHNYFTINEADGKLTLKRRINFDGVFGVKKIDNMTLTVTDKGHNQVKKTLTITVTDINDNPPSFGDIFYHLNVTENGSQRMELANFAITDADSGRNGEFDMDLAGTTYVDIFTVQGTSLMVETSKVDYEQLQNQQFAYTLTVRATDRSDTGPRNVGKATVVVEVLPINEYYPKWTSPKLRGNSLSFDDKTIHRYEPVGTIVETFQAEDDDKGTDGTVTYRIISVKSEKGEDMANHFFMDKYSGQLKTACFFDIKNESSFYHIMVQAIDGGSSPKSVNGQLKVNLEFGGTGLPGVGGTARMEGGMPESVKPAVGMGGTGIGVGGGAGAGAAVGMSGGMMDSVRPGTDAARIGGARMGAGGGTGADTGGHQNQSDGVERANVSGRFGTSGAAHTQQKGTVPSRGGSNSRGSCDDGNSGCAGRKDHRDGSGRSVSRCSTVVSYINTEIWVMRGGYGLLLFLGALGLLVVVWKKKNTRLAVAPLSSVSGFGPRACPGLEEFQSSAPMDTHQGAVVQSNLSAKVTVTPIP